MSYFKNFELPNIKEFPSRTLDIRDFGADERDLNKNKAAIAAAIDECAALGGGTVIIPKGRFSCGPIRLKSNVNLHLEKGCVLEFSQNYDDYLPAVLIYRGGMKLYGPSPLIYAVGERNIAVTGEGLLEGNGIFWWGMAYACPGMQDLRIANHERRPLDMRVYDTKESGVRPEFIHFIDCEGVLLEDFTLQNSPSWSIHPMICKNVHIKGVTVKNPNKTPNTDGIDIECCKRVLIEDCDIDTWDDVFCIKSGRNEDAWDGALPPCEDVLIRNSVGYSGAGGATVGSETSGGVNNVAFENCRFEKTRFGIRVKTARIRGGVIENLLFKNLTLKNSLTVGTEITVQAYGGTFEDTLFDSDNDSPEVRVPTVRNIDIENVKCVGAPIGIRILGLKNHEIDCVNFKNCEFDSTEALVCEYARNVNMENLRFAKEI